MWEALRSFSRFRHQDAPPPPSPRVGEGGRGMRGSGKPLRAIFRFRHQDAPTPLSPLVGEGGRGDEGQKAWECRKPRIAPKNSTLERKGAGGMRGKRAPECRRSLIALKKPAFERLLCWQDVLQCTAYDTSIRRDHHRTRRYGERRSIPRSTAQAARPRHRASHYRPYPWIQPRSVAHHPSGVF